MSEAEYCVACGAQALRDEDGELVGWAATIAMDPDCDHEFRTEPPTTLVDTGSFFVRVPKADS